MDFTTYELWGDADSLVTLLHTPCKEVICNDVDSLSHALTSATRHNAKCPALVKERVS